MRSENVPIGRQKPSPEITGICINYGGFVGAGGPLGPNKGHSGTIPRPFGGLTSSSSGHSEKTSEEAGLVH